MRLTILFTLIFAPCFGQPCEPVPDSLQPKYINAYACNEHCIVALTQQSAQYELLDNQWRSKGLPLFWIERKLYEFGGYLVRVGSLYGVLGYEGEWKITPEYTAPPKVVFTQPSLLLLEKEGKQGLMDTGLQWIFPLDSQVISCEAVGVFNRKIKTAAGTMDKANIAWSKSIPGDHYNFNLRWSREYQNVLLAQSDYPLSWVVKQNGKWGAVNGQDSLILNTEYDSISRALPYYILRRGKQYGIADSKTGAVLAAPQFDSIWAETGTGFIGYKQGKYYVYSIKGKLRFSRSSLPIFFDSASPYCYLPDQYKQSGCFLDSTGMRLVFEGVKEPVLQTSMLSKKYLWVKTTTHQYLFGDTPHKMLFGCAEMQPIDNGKYIKIIDDKGYCGVWNPKTGHIIVQPIYRSLEPFLHQGILLARDSSDKMGVLAYDAEGNKTEIPFEYDAITWDEKFYLIAVQKDAKWGFLNYNKRSLTIPCLFTSYRFSANCLWVKNAEEAWLLFSDAGKQLIDIGFDEVQNFACDAQKKLVRKADKWGIVDEMTASVLVPTVCDKIEPDCRQRAIYAWVNKERFCLDIFYKMVKCFD